VAHWFLHVTGIDTQQSPFYDFWSGIATQATVVGAIFASYRHKNCQKRWCPRLGHPDPETNLPVCNRHRTGGKT
jgi:hypothetical protein